MKSKTYFIHANFRKTSKVRKSWGTGEDTIDKDLWKVTFKVYCPK